MTEAQEFRYMTYEQRAAAGYTKYVLKAEPAALITVCRCGKTVLAGPGVRPGTVCPRGC
jgi:hypothetical protein